MHQWLAGWTVSADPAVITITSGPTVSKVSGVTGKDSAQITWQSDIAFTHYQIRVVPATNSTVSAGTQVESDQTPAAGGAAATDYTDTILRSELASASAVEGTNILKIFVQNASGVWSL